MHLNQSQPSTSPPPPRVVDLDHLTATNQEIVNWCTRYEQLRSAIGPEQNRELGSYSSNLVLKLNDDAVVKYGTLVTASEAANQSFIWNRLDLCLIRVPRVYRYFQDLSIPEYHRRGRTGYLVMEFMPGTPLSEVPSSDLPSLVDKVANAVRQFSQLTSNQPGPVDGGEPRGNLWAPDFRAYECFKTVDDLEAWFNRALIKEPARINFKQFSLCFCHLDLARRNILLLTDGSLCLLDWGCAGFYPRNFEIWNLRFEAEDRLYTPSLLTMLPNYTAEERAADWLIHRTYYWNMLNAL